ncbi:transporter [Rhodocytophaga aerolata]|uniref:Transporter n=1 Tax=Rhodocytophaga aerolata TaxID=455078 RepID=A0ABT8RE89_9BACT|nr:transporter [Rhodocytophaga aerolata]MDO1449503.1 transporter [Rhodocytophaga aerolata]
MARAVLLIILICHGIYVQAGLEVIAVSDTTKKLHHLPALTIDRPDQTDSPYVVPAGSFQVEIGIQHVWDKYREDGVKYTYRSFTYPNMLLRYGIFKRLEVRLEQNYSVDKINSQPLLDKESIKTGWHPTLLATKILLFEQKGWRPNFALLAKLATPYHSRKNLALPYKFAPGLVGAFSHAISDRFVLDGSAGGMLDQATGKININYSLSQAISLTKKLSIFVEVFCYKPAGEQVQYATDVGLLYVAFPHLQLDIFASKSLSYQAADVFAGVGIGIRLPR